MTMITFEANNEFIEKLKAAMKKEGYKNRSEYVRVKMYQIISEPQTI